MFFAFFDWLPRMPKTNSCGNYGNSQLCNQHNTLVKRVASAHAERHLKLGPSEMARGRKTGGGSRRGIPNRLTASAKAAFDFAFQDIGGEQALANWARKNRGDFYRLYARQIPMQHNDAPLVSVNIRTGDPLPALPIDPIEASRVYMDFIAGRPYTPPALPAPEPTPTQETLANDSTCVEACEELSKQGI